MWTMIIADDEPIIIRGIQKIVDWKRLGINIVGTCSDGTSAWHEIIQKKPDLAILDIAMPGKTGLDILKEINFLQIETKVIFVSGFQQFDYAVEALRLGAVNYLLKPVNKKELIDNVKKCIVCEEQVTQQVVKEEKTEIEDYELLIHLEQVDYIPAAVTIIWKRSYSSGEKKLIEFTTYHTIEKIIEEQGLGIFFYKDKKPCIVFKKSSISELKIEIHKIQDLVYEKTKSYIGVALGEVVKELSMIAPQYQRALKHLDYFYFSSYIKSTILIDGEKVFAHEYTYQDLKESRSCIVELVIEQDQVKIKRECEYYKRIVATLSEGDKETAVFNMLTVIRVLEERLDQIGAEFHKLDSNLMIVKARECENYDQMCQIAYGFLMECLQIIQKVFNQSDKIDIIKAKIYIEDHYLENLTLKVMADHIYMNASYFSSFFKKQTGENFKMYLNKIRLKQAVYLLLSTDKKSYEIADDVGFSDAKYFSELFQKVYGKTPVSYRKDLRNIEE